MGFAIDFAKLKAEVPILDVAIKMLGADIAPKGDQYRGACPICKSARRAFVITPAKQAFFCFSTDCNSGGDAIELVARAKGLTDKNRTRLAAEAIVEHFKVGSARNAVPQEAPAEQPKRSGFDPLEYQKTLQPDHAALTPFGISADTIRAFGGGFCTKGLLVGRLALPLTDATGAIVSFFGIGIPAPHDLKFSKEYPDLFGRVEGGVVQLVAHPLAVLRAYEGGIESTVCALKPLTWEVLLSLAELLKATGCEHLELY